MAWRAWLPDEAPARWQALLIGAAIAGAGTLVRAAIEPAVGHDLPFITYFPALIAAAVLGGGSGGATCLLLATVAVCTLFLRDRQSVLWAVASFWISGGLVVVAAAALADSVRALRRSRKGLDEAQEKLKMLVGELAHRNRNALAVIMAIVAASARGADSADDAARIINERLEALARAQELVVAGARDGGVRLRAVVEASLAPFDTGRFILAPALEGTVAADHAAPLGLVLHELATNAVKYGALSVPGGRVVLEGALVGDRARLCWREMDGPPVTAPAGEGFGGRLFRKALTPFGGTVERRFEPQGLVCELWIPLASGAEARSG